MLPLSMMMKLSKLFIKSNPRRPMNKFERTLAIALETLGCCVVIGGIAVEIATRAAIGHVIITSGSALALVGGLLFVKIFGRIKS